MPRRKYFFIILVIISLACVVPNLPLQDQTINNTETSLPVFTETLQTTSISTFTFTPTLIRATARSVTETFTPNPSATFDNITATVFTAFPTATVESVKIEVSRPTNCRIGPGKDYEIAGTLLVGETAIVLGRDPSSKYWYIPNPDPSNFEYCWVWGEYASFVGSNLLIPMLTALPTPTGTATALPSLPFNAVGRTLDKCNDSWWIDVEITNKSELTLRSVYVEMLDTNTDTIKFNSSDGFINRDGCGTYYQTETLTPNKSYTISGPTFPYNVNGNTLRVFVTVCTEKDQKGICNTIKIAAKP